MEYDRLAVNNEFYSWSEALGEVVDPRGEPILPLRDGATSPHYRSSRPQSRSSRHSVSRPASRNTDVIVRKSSHGRKLSRTTSLQYLPSQEDKEKVARIRKLEKIARKQEKEVEKLREKQGEEVDEALERIIHMLKIDDPEEEVALNFENM